MLHTYKLDEWQEKVLATKGSMVLRSGRQVGKSFIIAAKAAQYALNNKDKLIMIIAFTEKQALLLFSKILRHIIDEEKENKTKLIKKPKPTKHIINLRNGSTIHCYAAGDTGFGIMGFTIDLLIADEAAWIKEEVWNSIAPALAVTQGDMWLLSTPYISEGFYFDCFNDEDFTSFHQSSEDCPRITEKFLNRMKNRFTKMQYEQMYKGEFVDDYKRIFSDEWIARVLVLEDNNHAPLDQGSLGVDIAALGEDDSSFEGLERQGDIVKQFHHEITQKTMPTETEDKIIQLNRDYKLDNIGIDDGGMGIGVLAHLLRNDDTKRKVVGLNNSKREIDPDGRESSRLMKEAMYVNFLQMGEKGELQLFDNKDIKSSLISINMEENQRITGKDSHIVEGLIRAAWFLKSKELNMSVYTISV